MSGDPSKCFTQRGIQFGDEYPSLQTSLDILIGQNALNDLILGKIIRAKNGLLALRTKFGYIITGKGATCGETTLMSISNAELDERLCKFWSSESWGINNEELIEESRNSVENEATIAHFKENVSFNAVLKSYQVKLYFRPGMKIGNNWGNAYSRLLSVERKLKPDAKMSLIYNTEIMNYKDRGYAEIVPEDEIDNPDCYYMPHSVVSRPSLTTPHRIVFDASSHMRNENSLNSALTKGPNYIPLITQIIAKFRRNPCAVSSDIKKMFLQISVDPSQRDYLRFLWRNLDESKKVSIFRFVVLCFGLVASPFLSMSVIKEHCMRFMDQFPEAALALLTSLYVDDLLTGTRSVEEAVKLCRDLKDLMELGGFRLTKFASNNEACLREIPKEDHITELTIFGSAEDGQLNALGLGWDPSKDIFVFTTRAIHAEPNETKRSCTSKIALLFDPEGFLAPTITLAKILLRAIWQSNIGWDDVISEEFQSRFEKWAGALEDLSLFQIPRCFTNMEGPEGKITLHGFSDASLEAIGIAIYAVTTCDDGSIKSTLLLGKSKLAPTKLKITIARLELMSNVLLAKHMEEMRTCLELDKSDLFYWTDSKVSYYWIQKEPTNWKLFVSNRVKKIQELSEPHQWGHTPGEDNPADLPSRGITFDKLLKLKKFWLEGPSWLRLPKSQWPKVTREPLWPQVLSEGKEVSLLTLEPLEVEESLIPPRLYESLNKHCRILSFAFRFIRNIRVAQSKGFVSEILNISQPPSQDVVDAVLTPEELVAAEHWIAWEIQRNHFSAEISALQKGEDVPKSSGIRSLNPFLEKGLIKMRSRIQPSSPIIIPSKTEDPLIIKLVMKAHRKVLHSGANSTLHHLRTNDYWVIQGYLTCRKIIKSACYTCKRYNAKSDTPLMGSIPLERQMNCPWSVVGVDYTGPIYPICDKVYRDVRKSKERASLSKLPSEAYIKSWMIIFVCGSTRAIHIELVDNMTTETFISSLFRFINRRGRPKTFISDNAKYFRSASKLIGSGHIESLGINLTEVRNKISKEGIEWNFIPAYAPHWGGVYERFNRTIKNAYRKVVGRAFLSQRETIDILHQIEGMINSRPLSTIRNTAEELIPVTPFHLISGRGYEPPPNINLSKIPESDMSRRFLYQKRLLDDFWKAWSAEYLKSQAIRTKWQDKNPISLKEGDVVLVQDSNKTRLHWNLGRIIELNYGRDNVVRSAIVKTGNVTQKRHISQLFNMEAAA